MIRWELSWDIMEPVTYMITFITVTGSLSYFAITGSEYTYEGLHQSIAKRRLEKVMKRNNFDMTHYEVFILSTSLISLYFFCFFFFFFLFFFFFFFLFFLFFSFSFFFLFLFFFSFFLFLFLSFFCFIFFSFSFLFLFLFLFF